jgi:hypothetical protein
MRLLNSIVLHYRAWIEHSVLPLSDGKYLVQPLGRRFIYRVDQATKDRFVTFTSRVGAIIAVSTSLVFISGLLLPHLWQYGHPPAPLNVLTVINALTVMLAFAIVALVWSFHILRAGERVAPQLWTRPHPIALWPFWLRMAWVAASIGSIIWMLMLFRHFPGIPWLPIAALVLFLVVVFRRRRELFSRAKT